MIVKRTRTAAVVVALLSGRRRCWTPRDGVAADRAAAAGATHRDRRARHRARQVARGQPRGRLARSRGHRLSAAELPRGSGPPFPVGISAARLRRTRRHVHGRLAKLPESADRLAAAQGFSEPIVVTPNAFTLHKGSMYSNSVTTGDWETVHRRGSRRLHRRPLPDARQPHEPRSRRSLDGRIRRAADRDEAAGCVLEPVHHERVLSGGERNPRPEAMAPAEAIKTREQAEEAARAPGFGPSVSLASAAAWSPNPANPPLYLDLPVKDGKVRPDIVAKWMANAPLEMLEQYVAGLKKYYAIAIEVGTKDTLLASNRQLHEAMTGFGCPTATRSTTATTPTR